MTRPDEQSHVAAETIFLLAVAAAILLTWLDGDVYRFLFGGLNPLLVTVATAALGAAALRVLVDHGWFRAGTVDARSTGTAVALGAGLTLPVIIVDLLGGFPAGMNVRFPESLLFYPSIAVVAESAFHLVPLALLALVWKRTRVPLPRARLLAMVSVATIEPMLQVAWGLEHSPLWANAYVGAHLLLFNLVALAIFRRSGFVALITYRLGYYAIWHIAWGYLRLPLLFAGEV